MAQTTTGNNVRFSTQLTSVTTFGRTLPYTEKTVYSGFTRKGSATGRTRKTLADNNLLTICPLITHNSSFTVTPDLHHALSVRSMGNGEFVRERWLPRDPWDSDLLLRPRWLICGSTFNKYQYLEEDGS